MSLKRTKTQAGSAHGCYQASFEAQSMDLGGLGEHHSSIALLESSRKCHGMAWFGGSCKTSPLEPVFGLPVIIAMSNNLKIWLHVRTTKLIETE